MTPPEAATDVTPPVTQTPPPEAKAPEREATPPAPAKVEKPSVKASGPSEAELLENARRKLSSDPSGALELVQQHRARFRGGVLAQEREVIAIEALRRLGRTAEADARAEAFDRAFPNSAHRRKIDTGSR